ncbi:MAG TPA: hypothetical protein VNJ70_09810 [Thermoanaerobaculia bacterium]|nr:hypothetical protein [Thermoanaerobaculia bacterium]
MTELKHGPVPHDQEAFLEKARKRKGFQKAYEELGDEYALAQELLGGRSQAGLTQEAVAKRMRTTATRPTKRF